MINAMALLLSFMLMFNLSGCQTGSTSFGAEPSASQAENSTTTIYQTEKMKEETSSIDLNFGSCLKIVEFNYKII